VPILKPKELKRNWKIWAAANNVVKDCTIAETIDAVLTDTGNTEKRAAQLGVDELLKLLCAFHDVGIHFA